MTLTDRREEMRAINEQMRASLTGFDELMTSSTRAIAESRALLYEISKRHPEIDFDRKAD